MKELVFDHLRLKFKPQVKQNPKLIQNRKKKVLCDFALMETDESIFATSHDFVIISKRKVKTRRLKKYATATRKCLTGNTKGVICGCLLLFHTYR